MEIDILEKKENKVLDRTEIKFNCLYEGEATPKLLNVKNKLVALLNTNKELIVVDSIQPHFGETKAAGYAKVYDSVDSLKNIETKHVIDKNQEAKAPVEKEEDKDKPEKESSEEKSVEEESPEEASGEKEAVEEESPEEESTEEDPAEKESPEEESAEEDPVEEETAEE
jgi:small subunit ribosomal protein S24e